MITALEKDSKRDATKAEAETHQNTWNERSRVIDCTKNIAVTVLQSAKLSPEEKELLEAKETWNDLRSDPERLQKIQSVFQKLIKKNILSEQDKQSFQSVEKLLGISERKAQLTAMSRSPKLIKQTSAIIDTAR